VKPEGRTLYLVERLGSSTTELAIGSPGIKANDPDRDILDTGEFVFGEGSMASRLFKILRSQNGWTYGAYSGFDLLDLPRKFGGAHLIYAFPQVEHTEKLAAKAIQLYEDFVKKGVTPAELRFAKKSMTSSYAFKFATSRSRLNARLYQLLDGAPLHSVAEYKKLINAIKPAQIVQAGKKVHDPENLVIVAVGDPAHIRELKNVIPKVKKVVTITDPMKAF
jgi:zinc protease